MHGVCREGDNCNYSHDLKDKPSMVGHLCNSWHFSMLLLYNSVSLAVFLKAISSSQNTVASSGMQSPFIASFTLFVS